VNSSQVPCHCGDDGLVAFVAVDWAVGFGSDTPGTGCLLPLWLFIIIDSRSTLQDFYHLYLINKIKYDGLKMISFQLEVVRQLPC
jgi:hypothetical protein